MSELFWISVEVFLYCLKYEYVVSQLSIPANIYPKKRLHGSFARFLTTGGGTGDESYCEYMR